MTDRSATMAPTPMATQMKKNSRRRQEERSSRTVIRKTKATSAAHRFGDARHAAIAQGD
jgi:hypothetical protein